MTYAAPLFSPLAGSATLPPLLALDVLARQLEPLAGCVVMQFIRCGKRSCRCQTGERHGPYYYRVWRDGGRVRKVYVPVGQVSAVQRQCAEYQVCEGRLKLLRAERERLRQSLRLQNAQMEAWVRFGAAWDNRKGNRKK